MPVLALNLKRFVLRELAHFREYIDPKVTVANAGINILDCVCVTREISEEQVQFLMNKHHFDVIPVRASDGTISEYFTTKSWSNYNKGIVLKTITPADFLYYLTEIQDGIKKLAETGRKFYFLENEGRVVGLFSQSNINGRDTYLKLFGMLANLEKAMVQAVYSSGYDDKFILALLNARILAGGKNRDLNRILEKYQKDCEMGLEGRVMEYLYFKDIQGVFSELGLSERIKMEKQRFLECMLEIGQLRNTVAHPAKTLVNRSNSVKKLNQKIELLSLLNQKIKVKFCLNFL